MVGLDVQDGRVVAGDESGLVFVVEGDVLVVTPAVWARLLAKRGELGRCLSHDEAMSIARADWPVAIDALPGELEVAP